MKITFPVLLFLYFLVGCARKEDTEPINADERHPLEAWHPMDHPGDCETGKKAAEQDLNEEKLMLIRYGLEPMKMEFYWEEIEKAGIEIKFELGCEIDEATSCYQKSMKAAIISRKGPTFFEDIQLKADSLYQISRSLEQ